jgi:hypothetical protein
MAPLTGVEVAKHNKADDCWLIVHVRLQLQFDQCISLTAPLGESIRRYRVPARYAELHLLICKSTRADKPQNILEEAKSFSNMQ